MLAEIAGGVQHMLIESMHIMGCSASNTVLETPAFDARTQLQVRSSHAVALPIACDLYQTFYCALTLLQACRSLLRAKPGPHVDVSQRGVTLGFLLRLVQAGALDRSWTIQQ